jgi:hypothetical protein
MDLTEEDKIYLETKEQQYVKEFLEKFNNDFLYIHKNIYKLNRKHNTFILLNIPEEEESFKEFIREKYKAANVNLSDVSDFTNYKVYYTNTLQNVETIVENIKETFCNCGYVSAKMQLRFGIIWEGPTVEDEGSQIISDNSDNNNNTSTLKSLSISPLISPLSLDKSERRRRYYA